MTSVSILDLPANMQAKIVVTESGCWEWTGHTNPSGYGHVGVRGATQLTHRVSYELLAGPIPDGLQIDHLCRNKPCCNPVHLEPVTAHENNMRRPGVRKSHCKHGHPMTEENTLVKRRGGVTMWNCRECERQAQRRRRAEKARIAS
jgi:hypothetical protein